MKQRGFTLIEIIVATAIFTMVVTIAVGALTSLNNTSREARAMRVVMDNANSAMDAIARTIRMGIRFDCGANFPGDASDGRQSDCTYQSGGSSKLRFYGPGGLSSSMQEQQFRFNATSSSVERMLANSGTWERMTAPEVEVTSLKFYVRGAPLDLDQPIVTMIMTGIAHVSKTARNFTVQTSITPRTPNSHLVTPS
ncbi:MAG TPA: type II secretion system protein [Candidatus Paceibacterota bacterium]|nr:type II secretion system protein [Candidatus Paceibacterota bacterium]